MDLTNVELVNQLASKLARIHSIDVPLPKTTTFLTQSFDHFYQTAFGDVDKKRQTIEAMQAANAFQLAKFDLAEEWQWLLERVKTAKSPVVFCHNDFNCNNILIRQSEDKSLSHHPDSTTSEQSIVVIDWEFSGYNYRCFDLGWLFMQVVFMHTFDVGDNDFDADRYLQEADLVRFIKCYLESLSGRSILDSVDQLLLETRLGMLLTRIFMICVSITPFAFASGAAHPAMLEFMNDSVRFVSKCIL